LARLLELSTAPNLFDTHPAGQGWIFQIDGNFGAAAAVAEMLVQSHAGEIHFLPALPGEWGQGSVKGLRARGNVELDIAWKGGRATVAELRPKLAGAVKVRAPKGQKVESILAGRTSVLLEPQPDGSVKALLEAGTRYLVTFG
jgi:alpha-L-fucosidase 2